MYPLPLDPRQDITGHPAEFVLHGLSPPALLCHTRQGPPTSFSPAVQPPCKRWLQAQPFTSS